MDSLLKMIMSMVSDKQLAEMVDSLAIMLINYKNSFELLPDEKSANIILFEHENELYATVAAMDANDRVLRQIETEKVPVIILNMIKKTK